MKYTIILFLLILFPSHYFSQSIKGFRIADSLKNKNYNQLQTAYDKVFRIDNSKAELYANTILTKGKKENNNDIVYDGYYKIAHTKGLKHEDGHPYADSLLRMTHNISTKEYPAKAYIIKGILFNYDFKYNQALDQYIKAQELSKDNNPDQFYYIKKLIGILKTATGENEEALPLFLEYYNYEKKQISTNRDVKSYIGSIFSVSNAYNKVKNFKQCKFYNKLGISECNKLNDYTHYIYFILSEGITDYYLKNYSKAIENLLKTEKNLIKNKDFSNLSIIYYYLGKTEKERGREKQAINYFIKSDSLSFSSNDFEPVARDGYEVLIDYYKIKGDKENQLRYINKLFHADSIINDSKQYLSKEIYKKYDTPILLGKKEELITDLNNKNDLLYWFLGVGFVVIFCLSYIYVKNKTKIKEYQKQAELLFEKSKESSILMSIPDTEYKEESISKQEKNRNILSDNKLKDIKTKLELFENNKDFLQKNITVENLAKDLGTNRDYLSKSVNELKGKNFSQYLNELRINHIVEELKSNERIRKHTIAALADDIGFNNSESFSNAFKKITGTLPSYYIKLLQDQKKSNI